ncbi:MAG: ThiF family adenylyltransferase [Promethearchaeota archaeon]
MTEKEDIIKSRTYARQQLIEGWDQSVMDDACIMIVGVGALGCEIAKDFALMGVGKLILIDMDTIETSNLSRQMLFKPGDEGRYKSEVAAERLKEMNRFLNVDFYTVKLQNLPVSVYEESDVIIMALDNFNARMDLNKICLRLKKPIVEGGTVGFEGHVQVIIPESSGIEYGSREQEIEKLVEYALWDVPEEKYPDYHRIMGQIEEMEETIERLKERHIYPVHEKIRQEIEDSFDEIHAKNVLDVTPCYRCVVPIPPPDDKLVAACTLKGLPRNRNHCVIKADVDFEKEVGHKPDMDKDEDVLKLLEMAQNELEKLRARVFNENVTEEKLAEMTEAEINELKSNIAETFGPDYKFEEMENILGNKIAAIQTVSSIISSIESQEALKLLFRVKGRNIGPPMYPPYINYNGVYGQFDPLPISKRDDCLACGKIEGEEVINLALPIDAKVVDIWKGLELIKEDLPIPLNENDWMITNPMNKEIVWDPNATNPIFRDPNVKLKAELKINSNDMLAATPVGELLETSDIKKYNLIITYITNI